MTGSSKDPLYASSVNCSDCNGRGRFHCDGNGDCSCSDCLDAAAENAFSDQCESEPPVSLDEQHRAAWQQKQELRR